MKWTKQSEVEWGEVKCNIGEGGGKKRVLMEKIYRSSKWEVKDWGENVCELMIGGGGQLKETVRSTFLLGRFYLLYMLYSNLSHVYCC